jgi:hypothetical protein
MTAIEILRELAALSPAERREIAQRLAEMEGGAVDLRRRGIDAHAAAELRGSLQQFAEDWNSPEMSVYDDYDAAKATL